MLTLVPAININFDSVLEYYQSFSNKHEINSFTICSIKEGKDKYFQQITNSYETLYYLIDTNNPTYIIGFASLDLTGFRDYHSKLHNEGNISYGIRPQERNKGYGKKLLKLLLELCTSLNLPEVCISCTKANLPSRKIIEQNNGVLEQEFKDPWTNSPSLKYWIYLNQSNNKQRK